MSDYSLLNQMQFPLEKITELEREGKDAIEICHALGLKRWQLGNLGFSTGPWTGEQWDAICLRRGYEELLYPIEQAPWRRR